MPKFVCTAEGTEYFDDVDHVVVELDEKEIRYLLGLKPAVQLAMEAAGIRFRRLEVGDGCNCSFGQLLTTEPARSDQWYSLPDGAEFVETESQDGVVVGVDDYGVYWRMVPVEGDDCPVSADMSWDDLGAILLRQEPFPPVDAEED